MTPEQALIYCSENAWLVRVMGFLLVTALVLVLWVSGAYRTLKMRVRGWKRAERRHLDDKAKMLRELSEARTTIGDVAALKDEVRRVTRVREKSELRLVEQNGELECSRQIIEQHGRRSP